jgi:hypothetical protein
MIWLTSDYYNTLLIADVSLKVLDVIKLVIFTAHSYSLLNLEEMKS